MAANQKPPAIVAELGRPETAAETAARKAESSRLYKERKTLNNLVLSLIVTLGVVAVIFFIAPQSKGDFSKQNVDVAQLATSASPTAGRTLAAPQTPEGWKAKSANLQSSDGITWWQLNYTTSSGAYAAVVQAFTASGKPVSEKWVAKRLEQQSATGREEMAGIDWDVYDHADRNPDAANMLFGLAGTHGADTILVYGTDDAGVLRVLATDVAASLGDETAADADDAAAPDSADEQ